MLCDPVLIGHRLGQMRSLGVEVGDGNFSYRCAHLAQRSKLLRWITYEHVSLYVGSIRVSAAE